MEESTKKWELSGVLFRLCVLLSAFVIACGVLPFHLYFLAPGYVEGLSIVPHLAVLGLFFLLLLLRVRQRRFQLSRGKVLLLYSLYLGLLCYLGILIFQSALGCLEAEPLGLLTSSLLQGGVLAYGFWCLDISLHYKKQRLLTLSAFLLLSSILLFSNADVGSLGLIILYSALHWREMKPYITQ